MATFQPPVEIIEAEGLLRDDAQRVTLDALSTLDDDWTVWTRPRTGLDRPDFIAAHPTFGICVVGVFDIRPGEKVGNDKGYIVELDAETGEWRRATRQHRHEVARAAKTLHDDVVAFHGRPEENIHTVRSLTIAPFLTSAQAREIFKLPGELGPSVSVAIWGGDALPEHIERMLCGLGCPEPHPAAMRRATDHLTAAGRREPTSPAPRLAAVKLVEENPTGERFRRIRGGSGTGKTFAVAARAARLAAEGKRSIILTFGSTLPRWIRHVADARCEEAGADPALVTITSFHTFCARVVDDGEKAGLRTQGSPKARWPVAIIERCEQVFRAGGNVAERHRFDAVLVDEGQDFEPEWWNILRTHVVRPDGEMLIAQDPTQDLYERLVWTSMGDDRWRDLGIESNWIELTAPIRLPTRPLGIIQRFAHDTGRALVSAPATPDPSFGDPVSGQIAWIDVDRVSVVGRAVGHEVVRILRSNPDLKPSDVTFLCDYHHDGVAAAAIIKRAGFPVHHLFSRNPRDRAIRKARFDPHAFAVTGSTVHAFKGCESPIVVMSIGHDDKSRELAAVAMMRVSAMSGRPPALSVVNADPRLRKTEKAESDPYADMAASA